MPLLQIHSAGRVTSAKCLSKVTSLNCRVRSDQTQSCAGYNECMHRLSHPYQACGHLQLISGLVWMNVTCAVPDKLTGGRGGRYLSVIEHVVPADTDTSIRYRTDIRSPAHCDFYPRLDCPTSAVNFECSLAEAKSA